MAYLISPGEGGEGEAAGREMWSSGQMAEAGRPSSWAECWVAVLSSCPSRPGPGCGSSSPARSLIGRDDRKKKGQLNQAEALRVEKDGDVPVTLHGVFLAGVLTQEHHKLGWHAAHPLGKLCEEHRPDCLHS